MASGGIGNITHVSGELFKMMAGVNMVHVPYRGGGPALTDLLGGQVQVLFTGFFTAIEYIRTGRLRALAVTSAARSNVLPDIPSLREFLPGYEASDWKGIGAPKDTPVETIAKLNEGINAALADPKMQARLADLGGTPFPVRPPTSESSLPAKLKSGARCSAPPTSRPSEHRREHFGSVKSWRAP